MKKNRIFGVLLAVLAMPMAFAGGGQAGGPGGKTQISHWLLGQDQHFVEVLVKEFNEANPETEIVPAYYSVDGIKDALKIAASSRTLPDMWSNWGGTLASFYVDNNLTYDFNTYAKEHGWDKIFSPGLMSLCTFSGKISGYPSGYSVLDIFYRKDIFAKYNLKIPTTLAEFEQVCAVLKQNGIIPIATGGKFGWHTMRWVEVLIEHYAGADLHDRLSTFKASHDCPEVIQAFTKYKEWCDKGYFPPSFITTEPNDSWVPMFGGQAAMLLEGNWWDRFILENKQDISLYATFPFPSGGTNRLSAFASLIQFNKNVTVEKIDAAIQYLEYERSNLPRFGNYSLARLDAEMPKDQPNVAIMFETAAKNGTFTITDQAFPTEIADELFRIQDGVALNQVTPQQGAASLQAAIEAYLKK